jgi:hypothetical protein
MLLFLPISSVRSTVQFVTFIFEFELFLVCIRFYDFSLLYTLGNLCGLISQAFVIHAVFFSKFMLQVVLVFIIFYRFYGI